MIHEATSGGLDPEVSYPMFLYIDATSGGLLVQVLLGGFAGVGFVARLVWSRIGRSADQSASDEVTELPSDSNEERNAA